MQAPLVRYRSIVADSERWDGFAFRDGDIVISTPPKCGTTWTQMICALLVFQTADFDRPLDVISPWLDQTLRPLDEVKADLGAQQHRRFIKSHTPLDGLPFDERVIYITVGRDPRDVAMSWDHHMANLDLAAFIALREKAVGLDDLAELMPDGIPVPPESARERFWNWVDDLTPIDRGIGGLSGTIHHLDTFWAVRDRPNIVLLHYAELQADLVGQMHKLASDLGIDVDTDVLERLAPAASFANMRERATAVAPNTTEPIWLDSTDFFHRGTNGQWRDFLDEDDLRRYAARVAEVTTEDLARWVHHQTLNELLS